MENIIETIEDLNNCSSNLPFFDFDNQIHLAKIVKCYDGDTIHAIFKCDGEYKKFKVRLSGYDAPEIKPSKNIDEELRIQEKDSANVAKKKLEELILNKCVYLYCEKFDKYGRILATIKINKDDTLTVNQIMLQQQHCYVYNGGTKKVFSN